jgi:hypothetical protein
MFFYAIPDDNLLLEGSGGVYEALKQRLRSAFSQINPVGVKINLEELGITPEDFLIRLGEKLVAIFETAYSFKFDAELSKQLINHLADESAKAFAYDISYRRLFVVSLIESLQKLRNDPDSIKSLLSSSKEVQKVIKTTGKKLETKAKQEVTEAEF